MAVPKQILSYEDIGKGSLSLNAARPTQFIPRMAMEFLLLARNTRPDVHSLEPHLLMGTRASKEEKSVKMGEKIYLTELDKEREGKRGVVFSSSTSSFWISPISMSRNGVTVEIGRFLQEEQREERSQLVLPILQEQGKQMGSLLSVEQAPFVKAMKEAKQWGKDRLLEMYGGESYRALREKEKIQFGEGESGYVCLVSTGDFLIWEEQRWKVAPLSALSSSLPLAKVKTASSRGVEMELWDEPGFFHSSFKLSTPSLPVKSGGKEPPFFSSIRLRNGSQITCLAGTRRIVIREGDWLLKTATGWRNLKRMDQIEDYIHHRLQGELFVFDGLETVQGKTFMKGHFFDAMRSSVQMISFPIAQDKNPKNKVRRGAR